MRFPDQQLGQEGLDDVLAVCPGPVPPRERDGPLRVPPRECSGSGLISAACTLEERRIIQLTQTFHVVFLPSPRAAVQPRSIDLAFGEHLIFSGLGLHSDPVIVGGRYRIERRVGAGGFGIVYEAHDSELDRAVAIKVLPIGDDLLDHEGLALAQLSHPNIVQVYDHGIGDDFRFVVLELLPGATLREWALGKSSADVLAKFSEAGRGLAAAHGAGLVHRDFKPANVMIGKDGRAVVVDFGLARNLAQDDDSGERVIIGTMGYLAPERLVGDVGDHRADQFSFCVALWEALTGALPFGRGCSAGEQYTRIAAGLKGRCVTRSLTVVLSKGLSLHPSQRYASMDALLADADRAAQSMSAKWRSSLPAVLVGLGLIVLGSAGVLAARKGGSTSGSARWARTMMFEIRAERAATEGNGPRAVQAVENAMLGADRLGPTALAEFGLRLDRTALALGRAGDCEDAALVWVHAVVIHRRAGQPELEQLAIAALRSGC